MRVVKWATNETPVVSCQITFSIFNDPWLTYLISKTVGFIAAWFLADSPIKRSLSVNETNEGVVKLP